MKLQVLVSTMHQNDYSLLEKMNIQSDAIIVNQCDKNEIKEFNYNGYTIKWISLNERGVGLSRNTALMRATADIVLFADDDVVYEDGYVEKVIKCFTGNPKIGIAVFNLDSLNPNRKEIIAKKTKNMHLFNCLKFGAFRIAIKREKLLYNNVYFSLLFGGGAKYSAGEDNLFVSDCLKKGIKGLICSDNIGTVAQKESTWFKGYNKSYFYDKGILMSFIYGKLSYPLSLIIILKNFAMYKENINIQRAIRYTFSGAREARNLRK